MRNIIILLLFFTVTSFAGTNKVTVIWDAPKTYIDNTTLPISDIIGYNLYQRLYGVTNSLITFVTNMNLATNITYLYTNVDKGIWMFTVTTFVNGRTSLLESAKAPEVKLKVPEAKASIVKIQSVTESN